MTELVRLLLQNEERSRPKRRLPPLGFPAWALVALLLFHPSAAAQADLTGNSGTEASSEKLTAKQQDSQWGYVDAAGRYVIPAQFDSAGEFAEGVAAVEVNKRFGYIAGDGHFVIKPKYFRAGPFRDGFAWVVVRKPWTPLGTGEYGVALYGQVTYIDHSGREIRPPFPAEHVSNFSGGLAAVRPGKMFGGCSEKVGYLNTKGEWSIKPQFDEALDFSEGLAAVNRGGKCHMGGKWGYIDKDGTLVIPFQYDYAGQFSNGQACVEEAEQWQLIDKRAKAVPADKSKCLQ